MRYVLIMVTAVTCSIGQTPPVLQRPDWLGSVVEEHAFQSSGDASHLHFSYDAKASPAVVLGGYETTLRMAVRSGVKYTESGDGHDAIVRASRAPVSCGIRIQPAVVGSRVEVDCELVTEAPPSITAITTFVPPTEVYAQPTPTSAATPHVEKQPDFRQTYWGMSKGQVVASEHVKLSTGQGEMLAGFDTVTSLHVAVVYQFVNGQLGRASYVLTETYTEPSLYLVAADRILQSLADKYGQPTTEVDWRNELYKGDTKKYGSAISAGHLAVRNRWETSQTKIVEGISGENFKVSLAVVYTGRNFEAAFAQKERETLHKAF